MLFKASQTKTKEFTLLELGKLNKLIIRDGCSHDLIINSAKLGYGRHEFISDNEDLNMKVISLLTDSLNPFIN
jgi:hypothetical protein